VERRKLFLQQNDKFLSSGSFKRMTSLHLYIAENIPTNTQEFIIAQGLPIAPDMKRFELGNYMWSLLPAEEKDLYAQKAKDQTIDDIKGKIFF